MRVLVGCESSGTVREAFRALGHDAWSCDLLPADDGSPFHLQGDVLQVIAASGPWDMLIAHPPCTDLAVSGSRYFAAKRADGRQARALAFVQALMDAPVPHIAIENPVSVISSAIRPADQTLQPYQFGHDASKRTCLWLKNLPPLNIDPALFVAPRIVDGRPRWANQTDSGQNRLAPSPDRWKLRSKTYQGIADAMARDWTRAVQQGTYGQSSYL